MARPIDAMVPHMTPASPTPRMADAANGLRHIFVRDLVLSCSIGVYRHERDAPQRVRLNLDLAVAEDDGVTEDHLEQTVSYEAIVESSRSIVSARHYNLVETLAEILADNCLTDQRVRLVRVRVEKLDVFPDAAAVGVEIERDAKIK